MDFPMDDQEADSDRHQGQLGRVGLDPIRRARFQPLLLTGAYLTILPALYLSDHPARRGMLAAGVVLGAFGVGAWWWGRSGDRPQRSRELVALLLTLLAAPAFLALVAVLGADHPESYLPLGAALVCAMAPVTRPIVRLPVQFTTAGVFAVLLVQAERSLPDVLLPLALLASVGLLATALARDLVETRAAERSARRDAQRRAELLTAVRALPGTTLEEAAAAACSAMRVLGFDASGCAVLRGGTVVTMHLDGIPETPGPLRIGEGLAGVCMAENRTVVVGDYQTHPRRLPSRQDVQSAVVVPIRVDGEATGSLMGARRRRGEPSDAEVEVAEVLAAHLGAVFATEGSVRRQRELLSRMGQLEAMRSSFVAQVSDELRDPLTIVRGVSATMAARGPELEPDRRQELFGRMASQTDQLRRTIDALLDFSRFQSTRPEPAVEEVGIDVLLGPVLQDTDAELVAEEGALTSNVCVDGELVRHALELLVAGAGAGAVPPQLHVSVHAGSVRVEVQPDAEASAPPALVRSLAAQLLVVAGAELESGAQHAVVRLPVVDDETVAP